MAKSESGLMIEKSFRFSAAAIKAAAAKSMGFFVQPMIRERSPSPLPYLPK
ncbi:MAG: hypothetical protein LBB78_06725 [Spirochaetaceae bacterium]|jgi:hypothetical protein|nr:hypothetical protein [Spirochaetaceae bacterium]